MSDFIEQEVSQECQPKLSVNEPIVSDNLLDIETLTSDFIADLNQSKTREALKPFME
jgi:hypothetical protein